MFKAGTVTFKEPFSRNLGRQMGHALVEKLGQTPKACWLFCSPQKGLEELLAGINDAVGTRNVIGCTTGGEISSQGFSSGSAVMGGIACDQIDFQIAFVRGIGKDSEEAGRELAKLLPQNSRYIQLFSDGLTGNGSAILRGMASVLGEHIPIIGGASGDDGEWSCTWGFAGAEMLSDAAVAISFTGDFGFANSVRSGWAPIGVAKKVTRASGNILYELNGEPALKVFERFLGKHAEKLPQIGLEYPLCLVDKSWGDVEEDCYSFRAPFMVSREDGSISHTGDIPEGVMARLSCVDSSSILEAAGRAARLALADLGDLTPGIAFVYSCWARVLVLGRRSMMEAERISQELGNQVPLLGFYTYGEYGPLRPGGPSLMHNVTASISVIGS